MRPRRPHYPGTQLLVGSPGTAGEAPDTFTIGVPGTELRLAQSPLRIYPPFVALTPPFIPEYQTWTFRSVE